MSRNLDDSVAAHALNALPEDERALVEAAIDFDEELRIKFESYQRVASELVQGFSDVVPAASPQLWDRIALAAGLESSPDLPSADPEEPTPQSRWHRIAPIVLSIAVVAISVAVTAGVVANRVEPPGLGALAAASAELPGSLEVSLVDPAGGPAAVDAVVTVEGEGFIDGSSLPTLPENRTYQLWAIVGDQVISVGIMGNRPEVSAFRVEGQLAGLAISKEVLGGVVVSEQDPVALWLDTA
jgi:anti-sigma-K factor RskA